MTRETFEIALFVAIVNGWKVPFISGKSFMIGVAGVLDGPLKPTVEFITKSFYFYFSQAWFSFLRKAHLRWSNPKF